jgi:hypothetical protein
MMSLQSHLLRLLAGCGAVVLPLQVAPVIAAEYQLLLRPSQERFPSGDRVWWLEWSQGKQVLQHWATAPAPARAMGSRSMDLAGASIFNAAQCAGHQQLLPGSGLPLLAATP